MTNGTALYQVSLKSGGSYVFAHVEKGEFLDIDCLKGTAYVSPRHRWLEGKTIFIPVSDVSVITEETKSKPVTAYGRSKLLAEKELSNIKIPLTILRPTAVYGPRDKDIFIMIKTINKGFDPYIGNFLQQLTFVHARDVADVAVQALFLKETGIYNISDGNNYSRYQFADIAKKVLKKNSIRFHIPMPLIKVLAYFMETTNGWVNKPAVINREKLHELAAKNWSCDISKAKRELNFNPKFNLEDGLKDTIQWYQNNKLL